MSTVYFSGMNSMVLYAGISEVGGGACLEADCYQFYFLAS